jgi:hypothetical protein
VEPVLSNCLVLERGVAMAVHISFVPDGTIEFPEEVNELANPQSSREVSVVYFKSQ